MVSASVQTEGLTLEEYVRLSALLGDFEIINGERIIRPPTVAGHAEIINILMNAILTYLDMAPMGQAMLGTTFILPDSIKKNWAKGSRIPDLMFFAADRLADYKTHNPDWKRIPYALVPDLAVEVLSETDNYSDILQKVEIYLQDGVHLIWVIDPKAQKIAVHMADVSPRFLTTAENLDGAQVLPNFEISIASLFE